MPNADTIHRIDTARDILVGKVPDPKSQVEQITIALIYKFMDDMDAESEEFGGKRKFFDGEFARYGWAKLMHSGLGGNEILNIYAEAIARMPENPGIPLLFRNIFKNAYLPYRDPETLKMFLKVIDEFIYDHSERLGDAFEYLLSVLGSQGEAGQFRTPRHIIDFMVEVIDPKKTETVLDPACGTAGFLISSWKHILKANTDEKGNSTLTPDEKGHLAHNFKGYDISPDMVRLSLVNMYLHGFADPHIAEYDTLTSLDKWNEYADVILANPPFMSPKGGIQPHKRFSIQSKRSEVLFVDYMAEHLTPNGRAGIIVPEGIIFQSGTAYKQLRKLLVEEYLVAVVSLPGGMFNPYSGVKTSILILDKSLARKANTIAFLKIENDGFGLGAQRREIDKNDLPQAQAEIAEYLRRLRAGESVAKFHPALGLVVLKNMIGANGDYNLSIERYREEKTNFSTFSLVRLDEVFSKIGNGINVNQFNEKAKYRVSRIQTIADGTVNLEKTKFTNDEVKAESFLKPGDILISHINSFDHLGKSAIFLSNDTDVIHGINLIRLVPDTSRINPRYAIRVFKTKRFIDIVKSFAQKAVNQASVKTSDLRGILIPLPSLEVQNEIVAEIEGYQKIIDGARLIYDNYRPHIPIDPVWPMVELIKVCEINPEIINPTTTFPDQMIYYIDISSVENETGRFLGYTEILSSEAPSRARRGIRNGDVLLSTVRPNLKAFILLKEVKERAIASTGFAVLRALRGVVEPAFLLASVSSDRAVDQMVSMMGKGAYPSLNKSDVENIKIPLPPLPTQQAIVAEIEAEQALVVANCEVITRFEKKIQATLARVWGEEESCKVVG
jgi:type I restriction enzyme M protein